MKCNNYNTVLDPEDINVKTSNSPFTHRKWKRPMIKYLFTLTIHTVNSGTLDKQTFYLVYDHS